MERQTKEQRFYTKHTDDILCLAGRPVGEEIATGQVHDDQPSSLSPTRHPSSLYSVSLFAPLSSLYSYESLYSRHSLSSLLPSASPFFSRRFLHSNHNLDARHSSLCFFDILSSLSSFTLFDLIVFYNLVL